MLALALATLLIAPPSSPTADDPDPGSPAAADYGLAQGAEDVEVILSDRGKAYLEARARLEAHPLIAAQVLSARLEGVPAPSPERRDRLLNILAALGQAEQVEMFVAQLRLAIERDKPTQLWTQLLRRQGSVAAPPLIGLVGDRELPSAARGLALELLIELSGQEQLAPLMAMVGRGDRRLQDVLRRALIRRATADPGDDAAIASAIDSALAAETRSGSSEIPRVARLLVLRAACCASDATFTQSLEDLVRAPATAFEIRVAALDGLRRLHAGAAALESLVHGQIDAALAGAQAPEVLVALALAALPPERAGALATQYKLVEASAPRLAIEGYGNATLAPDQPWLSRSQAHPWPSVRVIALGRVPLAGACDKPRVRELATIAGPRSRGGDHSSRVGRAAVSALGRCESPKAIDALRALLSDTGVDVVQRAEAARQLVLHDPKGPDLVAKMLLSARFPELARKLASALGRSEAPSQTVRDALCRSARADPMVAATAHGSFKRLFPGETCE